MKDLEWRVQHAALLIYWWSFSTLQLQHINKLPFWTPPFKVKQTQIETMHFLLHLNCVQLDLSVKMKDSYLNIPAMRPGHYRGVIIIIDLDLH